MKNNNDFYQRVLSIYPTSTGFSFSYFEGPRELIDWGNCCYIENNNEKLQKLIDTFEPKIIITEDKESINYKRSKKTSSKLSLIYKLAEENQIETRRYSRLMVKGVFECFEANNKYAIAILLSTWYQGLTKKLPPKPEIWMGQHYRMGLFDSISFAFAYFYTED